MGCFGFAQPKRNAPKHVSPEHVLSAMQARAHLQPPLHVSISSVDAVAVTGFQQKAASPSYSWTASPPSSDFQGPGSNRKALVSSSYERRALDAEKSDGRMETMKGIMKEGDRIIVIERIQGETNEKQLFVLESDSATVSWANGGQSRTEGHKLNVVRPSVVRISGRIIADDIESGNFGLVDKAMNSRSPSAHGQVMTRSLGSRGWHLEDSNNSFSFEAWSNVLVPRSRSDIDMERAGGGQIRIGSPDNRGENFCRLGNRELKKDSPPFGGHPLPLPQLVLPASLNEPFRNITSNSAEPTPSKSPRPSAFIGSRATFGHASSSPKSSPDGFALQAQSLRRAAEEASAAQWPATSRPHDYNDDAEKVVSEASQRNARSIISRQADPRQAASVRSRVSLLSSASASKSTGKQPHVAGVNVDNAESGGGTGLAKTRATVAPLPQARVLPIQRNNDEEQAKLKRTTSAGVLQTPSGECLSEKRNDLRVKWANAEPRAATWDNAQLRGSNTNEREREFTATNESPLPVTIIEADGSPRKAANGPVLVVKQSIADNGISSGKKSPRGGSRLKNRLSSPEKGLQAYRVQAVLDGNHHSSLRVFSLAELKEMTRNFRKDGFLGVGGFGSVFKGSLTDDKGENVPVAVKVLNKQGLQGEAEWLAEVKFLGHLRHPNLVRLIGFCAEKDQRLLVYEYLPNGSLDVALFGNSPNQAALTWNRRVSIAVGAARGLAFLHEEADHPVIYRDLKTSNILLDSNFDTKLSDFGLCRCGPVGDDSHVSTRVVGTVGYAAPEYVLTGHLTTKSDVWSFGVVLLELLTGRVAMDRNRPRDQESLVDWVQPYLTNPSKLYRVMDPNLGGRYSVKGAQGVASLILKCLSTKSKARPKMSEVVEGLLPLMDLQDMAGFSTEPELPTRTSSSSSGEDTKNKKKSSTKSKGK